MPKKREQGKRSADYAGAIKNVLKQVNPEARISKSALSCMESLALYVLALIASHAGKCKNILLVSRTIKHAFCQSY